MYCGNWGKLGKMGGKLAQSPPPPSRLSSSLPPTLPPGPLCIWGNGQQSRSTHGETLGFGFKRFLMSH